MRSLRHSATVVVLCALEKDPGERFATAEIFEATLADLAESTAGGARSSKRRTCPSRHAGCDAVLASLAAWKRFEYELAQTEANRAARYDRGWSPLKLLMRDLPEP